jgi:hypothetical protein
MPAGDGQGGAQQLWAAEGIFGLTGGAAVAENKIDSAAASGYSGTPLAKKLGIKTSGRVLVLHAPAEYLRWLEPLPADVQFKKRASADIDLAHVFVTSREDLAGHLAALRKALRSDAIVWISWPKKAAKVPTTVTEDTIRELALPLGFVDIKVCAVSEVWSGLKLMVRKELR